MSPKKFSAGLPGSGVLPILLILACLPSFLFGAPEELDLASPQKSTASGAESAPGRDSIRKKASAGEDELMDQLIRKKSGSAAASAGSEASLELPVPAKTEAKKPEQPGVAQAQAKGAEQPADNFLDLNDNHIHSTHIAWICREDHRDIRPTCVIYAFFIKSYGIDDGIHPLLAKDRSEYHELVVQQPGIVLINV